MKKIDKELLDILTAKARQTARLRMNHNFHSGPEDPLQRLLNAMEPGTYIRPHKHENPDKREVFFALRGTLCVVQFDDEGNITDYAVLKPGSGLYAAEVAERTYHTVLSLESGSIGYEVKDGPYNPLDDKDFAGWAPEEYSKEAPAYLLSLIDKLNLQQV